MTLIRRIAYIQFTDPAGYPPLEHSSRILADAGWDVLFLGTETKGVETLSFAPHPRIRVRRLRVHGQGLLQRLNYIVYVLWASLHCAKFRPAWLYASEPLAAPVALIQRRLRKVRILYHEHDSPSPDAPPKGRIQELIMRARRRLAQAAELCVLPQEQRLSAFVASTGRTGKTIYVPNYPRVEEIGPLRAPASRSITFYYHGSLNAERLPFAVLEALSRTEENPRLIVVGYETIGSSGYMSRFLAAAKTLGVAGRVTYLGPLPRKDILDVTSRADVGLSFMPPMSKDINMAHMTGASNKPFDYLARGLMLLVSDLPDWRAMFVHPGYARACNPYDAADLHAAMRWCVENPTEVRAMGEAGRQRIASDWNYETCFAPVLHTLEQRAAS